jgi:hypothetical protein
MIEALKAEVEGKGPTSRPQLTPAAADKGFCLFMQTLVFRNSDLDKSTTAPPFVR